MGVPAGWAYRLENWRLRMGVGAVDVVLSGKFAAAAGSVRRGLPRGGLGRQGKDPDRPHSLDAREIVELSFQCASSSARVCLWPKADISVRRLV